MIKAKSGFFYGWVILGVCFLIMFVGAGCVYYAFGIFLKPMIADLGCTRGDASVALSITMLMIGLPAPLVAVVINRLGTRKVMAAGMVVVSSGIALMSTISQLWHLWLFFGFIVGIGMAFGNFMSATTMINHWFVRRKGMAIGVIMAGVGIGVFTLSPIIAHLIDTVGWRTTWLILAAITFVLGVIPTALLARSQPEDVGQLPDGDAVAVESSEENPGAAGNNHLRWGTRAVFKTPTIWLIAVFSTSNAFAINMINAHQVAHLTDIGFSPVTAASILGLLAGASIFGRLLSGVLADRMTPRYLVAIGLFLQVIGLTVFVNAGTMVGIYTYIVLFGMSYGGEFVLGPIIVAKYYGRNAYVTLFALVTVFTTVFGAIAPVLAGYMYDSFLSYTIPFSTCIVFSGVGAVCALFARPPEPKP